MIRLTPLPLLLLVLVPAASGAELVVRDLRIAAGTRPTTFDFTVTTPTTSASGADGFDTALGLEFGGRWSMARPGDALGLVVGADAILDGYSYGGGDGLATTWLRLSAGPAFALDDRWTLSGEVGIQYGLSALNLPATTSATDFNATGTATGYDLRFGATWLASRRFGLGAHAGWLMATHDLTGDAEMTIEQAGWFIGIEAVWRFTDAPPRLE